MIGASQRRREILDQEQLIVEEMAVGGQLLEQGAEPEPVLLARDLGQGWLLFTEGAEPTEPMGIASQLGELAHLRETGLEIGGSRGPPLDSWRSYWVAG